MEQTQKKSYMSIKAKLMAAVAMLLVASFMVISSTYAWFTLSTAPEVTGITTKVGANGNLEIALYNGTNPTSNVGDSSLPDLTAKNITWGNVVSLTDANGNNVYGLDKVMLLPSVLNVTDTGAVGASPLATPAYGSDGRISQLNKNTLAAAYNATDKAFAASTTTVYGVKAIGNASGMSAQQLAWRNAKADVQTNLSLANQLAGTSLNRYGADLAGLVFQKANDSAEFDVTPLGDLITALKGTESEDGVIDYLEKAMEAYLIAAVAVANPNMEDDAFNALVTNIENECRDGSFPTVSDGAITIAGQTVSVAGTAFANVYTEYVAIKGAIDEAYADYTGETGAKTAVEWSFVTTVLTSTSGASLVDIDNLKVNGFTSAQLKEKDDKGDYVNMDAVVASVLGSGIQVQMGQGTGVYYDLAQVTGEVTASITLNEKAKVQGISLANLPAKMKTVLVEGDRYDLNTTIVCTTAPADKTNSTETKKLVDFYGYVLDLAFRTNAKESSLMLQTTAANRIYSESTNAETMGHGSTMTFTSTSTNFTVTQMAELMKSIRIVFADTITGEIYSVAGLDMTKANTSGVTVEAPIAIYTTESYAKDHQITADIKTIKLNETTAFEAVNEKGQTELLDLEQNAVTTVSVYVYLDGQTVDNGDVAITAESMTGSLNLQFSSNAELTPMNYADLQASGTSSSSSSSTPESSSPVTP